MPEGSPIPGRFSFRITPHLVEPLNCCADPRVRRVTYRKSAQQGWTDGVLLNFLGHRIASDPCRILVLFPRTKSAEDFNDEKLEPMIEATPSVGRLIDLKSRSAGNRKQFKKYPGGFLKLLGSNAPGDVKSTSAPVVAVEEPDDCNQNVKGQGDSIKMAEERVKAYHNPKIILGGTPTIEDVSAIDAEFEKSDKRYYYVPCHHCGEAHPLEWDNVKWTKDEANPDPTFGKHHPATARYMCPACGALWTNAEKNRNVRRAIETGHGWKATAPFVDHAGFHANELISGFAESSMEMLVRKFLPAQQKAKSGDFDDLITFYNSSLAKSWKIESPAPKSNVLKERSEPYAEMTVPAGGLMLVLGIDVQHNRLAFGVYAFGRGEESWLVYWGEAHGSPGDASDGVWEDADRMLMRAYEHASGAAMHIEACSIDSSDGQTSDAVYTWVRKHQKAGRRYVRAVKGASESGSDREIFSVPAAKSIDAATATKAQRYGLKIFQVGTQKAKDLILGYEKSGGRLNLVGSGPGRMHWYQGVRADYFDQITSEVKAPAKSGGSRRKVWQKKAGRANEALDVTVYALHAARSLKSNTLDENGWAARDRQLRQADLLAGAMPQHDPALAVADPMQAALLAQLGGKESQGTTSANPWK